MLQPLLQGAIQTTLSSLAVPGPSGPVSPYPDPMSAQAAFATQLSNAIAASVATAVQQYILTSVVTIPAPGPVTHIHKLLAP